MNSVSNLRSSAFICGFKVLCLLLCVVGALRGSAALAQSPATQPYPEITYVHGQRTDPPLNIFALTIDLRDPDVRVEVAPGGPDPDGPEGKWQTVLDEPSDIAAREGFEVAINGDFFSVEEVIDPKTGKRRGYHEGQKALVVGPAMTDGEQWSRGGEKPRPCLVITRDRRAIVSDGKRIPPAARQVIAGSNVLLRDGKKVVETESKFSTTRHPRSAAGVTDGGRSLVLVVVDGRRPQTSVGVSLDELAEIMLALGCDDALNLDGGGSSVLLLRDPETGELRPLNNPSDGKQRPVANILGVDVGDTPATRPAGE